MDINRLIIGGYLPGGETWATSCSWQTVGVNPGPGPERVLSTLDELQGWATGTKILLASAASPFVQLRANISSAGGINLVRTEYIADGALQVAGVATGAAIPGTGANNLPNQCSMVISLLTAQAGRSRRGRMYWPWLVTPQGADGHVNTSTVQVFATAMGAALFTIGATSAGQPMQLVVHSRKLEEATLVTSLAVGNVIDTQRRRRNQLIESYSAGVLG